MKELDKNLSSRSRWVAQVAQKRTERGHFRAAIITFGAGGHRRYEARAETPKAAMLAVIELATAKEAPDD